MSRKRERLEIIRDVLAAIREKGSPVKPTHILYKSNLSSEMLKQYLSELIEKGMVVEENGDRKCYSLTPKGYKYLKDFSVIQGFMESYGLE